MAQSVDMPMKNSVNVSKVNKAKVINHVRSRGALFASFSHHSVVAKPVEHIYDKDSDDSSSSSYSSSSVEGYATNFGTSY